MTTDTRRPPSRWTRREPCSTIQRPPSAGYAGLGQAAVLAQHLPRYSEHACRRRLDRPTQLGEPPERRGRRRFDGEPLIEDDQARRLGQVRFAGLPEQQSVPGAGGEPGRHTAYQVDVLVRERRSTSLAIQPDQAPGLAVSSTQGEEQLLVASVRLHLLVELAGQLRPSAGCVMQSADAARRLQDLPHRVVVALGVLPAKPLARDLGQALLEVTGRQQRRRIDREEARGLEVRDCLGQQGTCLPPQRHQV